jgi:hypothetical protein
VRRECDVAIGHRWDDGAAGVLRERRRQVKRHGRELLDGVREVRPRQHAVTARAFFVVVCI